MTYTETDQNMAAKAAVDAEAVSALGYVEEAHRDIVRMVGVLEERLGFVLRREHSPGLADSGDPTDDVRSPLTERLADLNASQLSALRRMEGLLARLAV